MNTFELTKKLNSDEGPTDFENPAYPNYITYSDEETLTNRSGINKTTPNSRIDSINNAGSSILPPIVIVFMMILFSVVMTMLLVTKWCEFYNPYLRCDLLPFLTNSGVNVIGILIVMLVCTFIIVIVGIFIIHHREKKVVAMISRLILLLINLILLGCNLCFMISALIEARSPNTIKSIFITVNVFAILHLIIVILSIVELIYLRKTRLH